MMWMRTVHFASMRVREVQGLRETAMGCEEVSRVPPKPRCRRPFPHPTSHRLQRSRQARRGLWGCMAAPGFQGRGRGCFYDRGSLHLIREWFLAEESKSPSTLFITQSVAMAVVVLGTWHSTWDPVFVLAPPLGSLSVRASTRSMKHLRKQCLVLTGCEAAAEEGPTAILRAA